MLRPTYLLLLWVAALGWPGVAAFADQTSTTTYGAWSVECPSPGTRCVATQKVATDAAGKNAVLGIIADSADPKTGPLLVFRLSNKAYAAAGAGMKIDDQEPLRAPITACDDKVCEVRARLTPELATRMSKGKLLIFAYFLDQKQQVSLPVSLNGFDRAWKHITTRKPAR